MTSIIYVFYRFFTLLFEIVSIAMFIRAITSWFPMINRESKLIRFIFIMTEVFIAPVRNILWKIPSIRTCPLDISFLVTYILLSMAQTFVYSIWIAVR